MYLKLSDLPVYQADNLIKTRYNFCNIEIKRLKYFIKKRFDCNQFVGVCKENIIYTAYI